MRLHTVQVTVEYYTALKASLKSRSLKQVRKGSSKQNVIKKLVQLAEVLASSLFIETSKLD